MQTMAFKMNAIAQERRKSTVKKKTPNRMLGRFALILFTREKADKVCRLVNFEMDKTAVDWKRCNDPKDDPIIQNPEKKQSLFINAFQINEKIMIVTKYRYLVYDTNLKTEVKAMNFSELG